MASSRIVSPSSAGLRTWSQTRDEWTSDIAALYCTALTRGQGGDRNCVEMVSVTQFNYCILIGSQFYMYKFTCADTKSLHSPFMLMCLLREGFRRPLRWSFLLWLWAVWFLLLAILSRDGSESGGILIYGEEAMVSIDTVRMIYLAKQWQCLELDHLALALLLPTQLEVFGSLDRSLHSEEKLNHN